jgi:hypothetical protein
LFGDQLGGSENNTRIEDRFADIISDFTDKSYGEEITDKFVSVVDKLYGCMGVYPDVLIPDDVTTFRGTTIPASYFIDNRILIPTKGNSIKYVYKASSPIQSWTTSHNTALQFGTHDVANELSDILNDHDGDVTELLLRDIWDSDLRIPFTLEYQTNPHEYMFKGEVFNQLSEHSAEHEILRVDNRPIEVIGSLNTANHSGYSRYTVRLYEFINRFISRTS